MGFTNSFDEWQPFPWLMATTCVKCDGPMPCTCWHPDTSDEGTEV